MSKIFYLMGKSSSGKDTIYRRLLEDNRVTLKKIVGYTTRPMRDGETEGEEYHFVSEDKLNEMEESGHIIEKRAYNTVYGIWYYFTADDGQVDDNDTNYILIGTVESYVRVREYYGENTVIPVYIHVDDGIRLKRALEREMKQDKPKYTEMCRRYIADETDFAEEKLREAGISRFYINDDIDRCTNEIIDIINAR